MGVDYVATVYSRKFWLGKIILYIQSYNTGINCESSEAIYHNCAGAVYHEYSEEACYDASEACHYEY